MINNIIRLMLFPYFLAKGESPPNLSKARSSAIWFPIHQVASQG